MAKPTPTVRLQLEDFPDQAKWIGKLLDPINQHSNGTNHILGGNLSLLDNMGVVVKEQTIAVPSDWIKVGDSTDPRSPPYLNGWSGSAFVPRFRKDSFGMVYVEGNINGGSLNVPAFFLPTSYRPEFGLFIPSLGGAAFGALEILSTGEVMSLVGSNSNFNIACSFTSSDRTPFVPTCFPIQLAHQLGNRKPLLVLAVVSDADTERHTAVASMSVDWEDLGTGKISIRNIPNLVPGKSYKVSFIIIPR